MKEKQLKWVLVAPALTMIVALIIFPLIYALRAALYLYRYGKPFQFVGLRNFVELFQNPLVLNAVINTVIYVAIAVTAELVLGLLLALIMNREIRGFSRPVRAALTIPMFIAPVVVGIIWRMMYNPQYGLFDWLLGIRNFAATGGNHALYFVALADVWQWTPFMYIIILASLQSVSPELIEASIIDGASQWQRTTQDHPAHHLRGAGHRLHAAFHGGNEGVGHHLHPHLWRPGHGHGDGRVHDLPPRLQRHPGRNLHRLLPSVYDHHQRRPWFLHELAQQEVRDCLARLRESGWRVLSSSSW